MTIHSLFYPGGVKKRLTFRNAFLGKHKALYRILPARARKTVMVPEEMMNESEFHTKADVTLSDLAEALEDADASGALDVEQEPDAVTLLLPSGKQYVISKHAASRQIWLSSPVSGGLHFSCDGSGGWMLADGRTLGGVLAEELREISIELAL